MNKINTLLVSERKNFIQPSRNSSPLTSYSYRILLLVSIMIKGDTCMDWEIRLKSIMVDNKLKGMCKY
jgi:hypothetical protein